jgi:hypothetical protein
LGGPRERREGREEKKEKKIKNGGTHFSRGSGGLLRIEDGGNLERYAKCGLI